MIRTSAIAKPAIAACLGVSLAALLVAAPSAQEVGRAGAVNPAASGAPPGASPRTLELGARIIHRERIQTTASGSLQLIFLDKTTLNIGPNSDLVIDEFVYDPAAGTGRMAATLTKGVMRFVGGQVSHTQGATVRTPATTLGIRGGVATISHDQQTGTRAINHFGRLSVNRNGDIEIIRRPGFGITIPVIGGGGGGIARVSQSEVDQGNQRLTSSRQQSGGSRSRPTEQGARQSGLGQTNGQLGPQQIVVNQEQTVAKPLPILRGEDVNRQDFQGIREVVRDGSQTGTLANLVTAVTPSSRAFAMQTTIDPALNSTIPYVLGVAVASGPVYVSPIYGYRNDGLGSNGREAQPARVLQAALSVNGNGATQTSNFMVMTGAWTDTPGSGFNEGFYFSGGFRHFTRRDATFSMGRANGSVSSIPGSEVIDSDRLPGSFNVNADYRDDYGTSPDTAIQRPGGGGTSSTYTYQQTVTRTTAPSGLGQNRPSAALIGFASGMNRTLNVPLDTHIEPAVPVSGAALLLLDPSDSRAQLSLFLSADRLTATPTGGLDDAEITMGSVYPGTPARSTYIDYDYFGGRDAVAAPLAGPNDPGIPLSTANGQSLNFDRSGFVSSATVAPAGVLSGITFCQCEYTRWGFWSQENSRTVSGTEYRDRIHLGTWLAGEWPSSGEIPLTGTATYAGHVIGSFRNGTTQYLAGGQFNATVNFGTHSGNFSIPTLDGRGYTGALTLFPGSPFYAGTLTSISGPTTTGDLNGAFFRGVAGPVGEMGGNIIFSGTNYSGAATFLGKQ